MADVNQAKFYSVLLLFLMPLALLACQDFEDRAGSSGLAGGPDVDVTGTWTGDWNTLVGSPDAGTVRFEIEQEDDGTVFGRSFWTGSPCWDDGRGAEDGMGETFNGRIEGQLMENPIVVEIARDPPGTAPRLGLVRVTARLEIIADLMVGSFVVPVDDVAGRRCTDGVSRRFDSGSIELRRQ